MSGGFNFQVNDGVNFTPRQIFSITAQALVLSLERNRPLKVFPGEFLLSLSLWMRSHYLGSIEAEDCGELMENQSTCPQFLWVNVSELFHEVRTKTACCHSHDSVGGGGDEVGPGLAQTWMDGMVEGRKVPAGTLR